MLLLGPPGSGKSDLVLRLLDRGWRLVADDQVALPPRPGCCAPRRRPRLRGMLEVRGLGIFRACRVAAPARSALVARLVPRAEIPRLPEPSAGPPAGSPCRPSGWTASPPRRPRRGRRWRSTARSAARPGGGRLRGA